MNMAETPGEPTAADTWTQALAEFTQRHGLSLDDIIAGNPFAYGPCSFRVQYHSAMDALGLVLMLDLGEIPQEAANAMMLDMLAYNACRPAALLGYFGMFAGSAQAAYCIRLDLSRTHEPLALLEAVVADIANSIAGSLDEFADLEQTAGTVLRSVTLH